MYHPYLTLKDGTVLTLEAATSPNTHYLIPSVDANEAESKIVADGFAVFKEEGNGNVWLSLYPKMSELTSEQAQHIFDDNDAVKAEKMIRVIDTCVYLGTLDRA